MSELSENRLQELKQIFNDFDKDNNGTLDMEEFCYMLDKLLGKKLWKKRRWHKTAVSSLFIDDAVIKQYSYLQ